MEQETSTKPGRGEREEEGEGQDQGPAHWQDGGDSEGKQVPPSFLPLQLRPQSKLPAQTGVLPLAEAPQQKRPCHASFPHPCKWPVALAWPSMLPMPYLAHPGSTSAGAFPHPRTLGNPAGACMRQDAQQSLLASRPRFVCRRIRWHWCRLGESRE